MEAYSAQQLDAQTDYETQPRDYKVQQTKDAFIGSAIQRWRQDPSPSTLRVRCFEPMTNVRPSAPNVQNVLN